MKNTSSVPETRPEKPNAAPIQQPTIELPFSKEEYMRITGIYFAPETLNLTFCLMNEAEKTALAIGVYLGKQTDKQLSPRL